MTEDRKTVTVLCRVPNGIMLRLTKQGFDDGTGFKPQIWDGAGVRLNGPSALHTGAGAPEGVHLDPVETEVDAEWFGKWLAQNAKNPLVVDGAVKEQAENPTT